ncbi:hypothetical protein [Lysinibacillus sp. NPDC056185]|uniref:hypothetical protein n=1 Tax=Lysinibacillus sp. NPDC056185 TaxID=3345739 RepID=UPI0039F08937
MFKKKILVGHSEDAFPAIIEHLKRSSVPFELGIKDILRQSSGRFRSKKNDEVYIAFYTVKVRKKYEEQVKAIVEQYMSQEDVKQWYKVSKKNTRKLEKKEISSFSVVSGINYIAMTIIHQGKIDGGGIVSYIACAVIMMTGAFLTISNYKEMQKESSYLRLIDMGLAIIGIGVMIYAVSSFLSLLR